MRLSFAGVGIEIGGTPIVHGVSVAVEPGEMAGLIGPNGSGKSTLLRSVYRHLKPICGVVWVGPDDVWSLKARDAARRTAAVPQERPEEFDVTVAEIIAAGRIPHKSGTPEDVLTKQTLEQVFGVAADIAVSTATGKLSLSIYRSSKRVRTSHGVATSRGRR